MICPNCKNSIEKDTTECEWCGAAIPNYKLIAIQKKAKLLIFAGIGLLCILSIMTFVTEKSADDLMRKGRELELAAFKDYGSGDYHKSHAGITARNLQKQSYAKSDNAIILLVITMASCLIMIGVIFFLLKSKRVDKPFGIKAVLANAFILLMTLILYASQNI